MLEEGRNHRPMISCLWKVRPDGRKVIRGRVKKGHALELFLVDSSSGEVVGTLAGRPLEPKEARDMWAQYYEEAAKNPSEERPPSN